MHNKFVTAAFLLRLFDVSRVLNQDTLEGWKAKRQLFDALEVEAFLWVVPRICYLHLIWRSTQDSSIASVWSNEWPVIGAFHVEHLQAQYLTNVLLQESEHGNCLNYTSTRNFNFPIKKSFFRKVPPFRYKKRWVNCSVWFRLLRYFPAGNI